MKSLECECGAELFFESTKCLACGREVRFSLERREMRTNENGIYADDQGGARKCQNDELGICNWLVDADDPNPLCRSCRLDRIVPDLSLPENVTQLGEVERAKRRLVYQLTRLGLFVESKMENPTKGLCFDVKSSKALGSADEPVLIGHDDGVITLLLEEANVVYREQTRTNLREKYRTMVGHCRHESGHYYFDRLIADEQRFDDFRNLFGDERADYAAALEAHYAAPPNSGWRDSHITPYAASHPWEDWAETWAHYLHMTATLETACSHQLVRSGANHAAIHRVLLPESVPDAIFDRAVSAWTTLGVALNELSRSLGLTDAYPFAWNSKVIEKLHFVHETVVAERSPLAAVMQQEPALQVVSGGRS